MKKIERKRKKKSKKRERERKITVAEKRGTNIVCCVGEGTRRRNEGKRKKEKGRKRERKKERKKGRKREREKKRNSLSILSYDSTATPFSPLRKDSL